MWFNKRNILDNILFHKFIRWALGIHGMIHILETILNVIEGAYWSALLSLVSSFIMISGAYIDLEHHKEGEDKC